MLFVRHKSGRTVVPLICRTLCVWAAWVQVGAALPQAATDSDGSFDGGSTAFALIPSQRTTLIPSAPPPSEGGHTALIPSQAPKSIPSQPPIQLIPSQPPPQLIPSQPPPELIPSQPAPGIIPSEPPSIPSSEAPGLIPSQTPPGLIPSQPPPGIIPSAPIPSQTDAIPPPTGSPAIDPISSGSNVIVTLMPSPKSTEEGLRPIPAPTTAPGDPNGHHEISEPDFSKTAPCRGCSPVIEISVTGFDDFHRSTAIADHVGTPMPEHSSLVGIQEPPKAIITAGPPDAPTEIIVSKEPTGPNFVIDKSTTVTPGQTVIYNKTPIVIQTSSGKTDILVGANGGASTVTIPLTQTQAPNNPNFDSDANPFRSQITARPLLFPVTIGQKTITPDSDPSLSQYVVDGKTLKPGGEAITIDGTTVSLLPSASAIVVNGVTSTLTQIYGAVITTTVAPFLTLNNGVYTANRAGYYIVAPGTTLVPGGPAITVSGTTISLEPKGTVAVIQGTSSLLRPVTTVVTLTRAAGNSGYAGPGVYTSQGGNRLPAPKGKDSSGSIIKVSASLYSADGWLEGVFMLGVVGLGWLAVWL